MGLLIEKLLWQLEAQGESVADQQMLIQQLLCKYPTEVNKVPGTIKPSDGFTHSSGRS